VEIRNIYVQWAPNEGCTTGDCTPYKAPSKCIGDYPNVLVAAGNVPPTALDDRLSTNENESVRIDILANDTDSDGSLNRSTVTVTRAPASGSASVDPTAGTVTYVPAPGTCGEDSFRYTVCDDDGAPSGEATVTVTVTCNQPPVANDDSATTDERTAIAVNVIANDHDADGGLDIGTIAIAQNPGFGSLSVHPGTGIVTYTPSVGACGDDAFLYTIRDDDGATSNPACVTVSVLCNDPPIAIDDLYNVAEGGTVSLPIRGVLANDQATPGRPLMAILVAGARHGALTLNSDGSFVYVHDGSETLDDSFTYKANDSLKDSNVATVSLVISPTNDAPEAAADQAVTEEDTPVRIDVLANDNDPDGNTLVVDATGAAAHGRVANLGSSVQYVPNVNFYGTDTFTYTAGDGHGGTATASVTVTVASVNDAPVAQNDSASTSEDVAVTVSVLANDSDADGDALAIESAMQPWNGSVTSNGASAIYTPNKDFNGVDTFTYTVTDGQGGTATATVTVTVAPVNDAPVAQNDSASTDEDVAVMIAVLGNDSDSDGDALAIESVTQPGHGTAVSDGSTATYTPSKDFNGTDTFTYAVSDGRGGTATATVTVTVAPVNDAPVAQNDSASTDEDVAVMIVVLRNDSDPDGDALAIQSVSAPADGTVEILGSAVRYSPASGFHGIDAFTYVVADGQGGTATATVTVNVATVNHPPVAVGGSVTTNEDVALTIAVLANDSDPDGDPLALESVTQPSNGFVTTSEANVTYTPNKDFNGEDAFTYTVADGRGGTATATVTVTVVAVVGTPIANDDGASTGEGTPVTVSVLANDSDPDGGSLALESVTSPANGTAEIGGSTVVYSPRLGFHGVDSFAYAVTNVEGGHASALVTIDVVAVNVPPEAGDDSVLTLEDTPVTIAVLSNDSDPDGDSLIIESNSQPLHGATIRAGSSIIYTPTLNYHGEDVFTYTVTDGRGGTAVATVRVAIVAVNDLPVAQDDNAVTNEGVPVTVAVLGNDRDPDGDALTVQAVTQPAHGSVLNARTDVTYTPTAGFSGTDSFTYTVADGRGGTDTAQVSVTVSHVNHAPIAQDDSASTNADSMVTIAVLQNDSDPDGDFLLVQSIGNPAHGTVLNSSTAVSYIPDSGFHGVDTFSYIVADGNGGTAAATVTVAVAAANQIPVARDDSAVTNEDAPVVVSVLANDLDPDGDVLRIASVAQPLHGSAVRIGTTVMYTPVLRWSGVDVFSYTVSDGRGGTATASVMVVVLEVNQAPTSQDDSATTDMDVPVSIPVLANDSDEDGDALALVSVTQPLHGMAANQATGVLYTPNAGFVGIDSFSYTVTDLQGLTSIGTVTVGVAGVAGGGGAASGLSCDGKVIISEVAWAGSAADAEDEWIELRNLGTAAVDLTGWTLQWRRTRPVAPEDSIWKVVELSGILAASSVSACDAETEDETPGVLVSTNDPSGLLWQISYDPNPETRGYFVLERTHEEAVSDVASDVLYDATRSPMLALSDLGEVIMLVNDRGDVVDTANASNIGSDEWAAGSRSTFGSMERVDPLGPDLAENWSTNMGVVTRGEDAQKHPLRATPGAPNSPGLEALYEQTGMEPVALRAGAPLAVSLPLSRENRRTTGWPWIITTRPGLDLAAGAGGGLDLSASTFSGRAKAGDEYILDIGTGGATPGVHLFWIVYGEGQALLMPVLITP
jgi:VCBS repeat-containing protein